MHTEMTVVLSAGFAYKGSEGRWCNSSAVSSDVLVTATRAPHTLWRTEDQPKHPCLHILLHLLLCIW